MRYTDGFTGKAILALKEAICAAEELGHTHIGSEHLLLGLLEEGSNAAAAMLAAQHITAQRVGMRWWNWSEEGFRHRCRRIALPLL